MSLEIAPRNYYSTAAVLAHDLETMLTHHPEAFDCIVFQALDPEHDEIVAENSPAGTLLDREERLQAYAEPVKARAMIIPDEAQTFGAVASGAFENFNDTPEGIRLLLSLPNLRTYTLIQWREYPTLGSMEPVERTVYISSLQTLGKTLGAAGFSYLCFPLPAMGEIPGTADDNDAEDMTDPKEDNAAPSEETAIGVL